MGTVRTYTQYNSVVKESTIPSTRYFILKTCTTVGMEIVKFQTKIANFQTTRFYNFTMPDDKILSVERELHMLRIIVLLISGLEEKVKTLKKKIEQLEGGGG